MSDWVTEEALAWAGEILRAGTICDECLGRGFAKLGRGLTNAERGRTLRRRVSLPDAAAGCWICGDLFGSLAAWAAQAAALSGPYEFETYLFGVLLTPRLREMEAYCAERFPTEHGESLRHAINRALGMAFERMVDRGTVDFNAPDVTFLVDLATGEVSMRVASVYLYGRYRKLVRGIPQTRWPCRACRGRGCERCGGTGRQYSESVEEWIGAPAIETSGGHDGKLHGAGREDIDARMLGDGRPFILEVVAPKRRTLDLEALKDRINDHAAGRIEVSPLRVVAGGAVGRIKEIEAHKSYRAEVRFDADVDAETLNAALDGLVGPIEQRTPQRVSHRRADKVRRRRVLAIRGAPEGPRRAVVEVTGEGGLYIKELISGDDGRTIPSLAGRLGIPARVAALDVLEVSSGQFEQLP